MSDPTITCPECKAQIPLTKALAAPLISATKKEFESLMRKKEADFAERESKLEEQKKALKEEVDREVELARIEIAEREQKEAAKQVADLVRRSEEDIQDLKGQLERKDAKLVEAQEEQKKLLRQQRELEEKERELELTVEKKVREGLDNARAQALKDAEDRMTLQIREKEETIEGMKRQIEDLRRKAEQGSQQLQGEVQELQLEELLKSVFISDIITPVPKGVHGGDILQVVNSGVRDCGTILWESKRTKTWSNGWLPKLRDDQRAAKADIAILVTLTPPQGFNQFDLIDGVWVCIPSIAVQMGSVLRQGLLEVAKAKLINEGMQTKAEEVYQYLTGPQFKRRVEAIVEAFSTMHEDLEKEKRAITKQWAKREAQIDRAMWATTGMHGDLQAIAGSSVQEVKGIEMKALGEGTA